MLRYRKVFPLLLAAMTIVVGLAAADYSWQSYVRSPLHDAALAVGDAFAKDELHLAAPADILVNVRGVSEPTFAASTDSRIQDALRVIGIVIEGRARAFAVDALKLPAGLPFHMGQARRHVVNQLIGDTAVSVTYCDTSQCIRVLCRPRQQRGLDLGVGGFFNGQLLLCLEGKQYYHNSREIPLSDAGYELTTWRTWKKLHPDSQIYLGE